jgi:hypothetical protein
MNTPQSTTSATLAYPTDRRLALRAMSLLILLAGAYTPAGYAADAHVHGAARLDVAVDGPVLTLILASPLDNFVGFEHAPVDAAQRAALQDMQDRLRDAGAGFLPAPAAGCAPETIEIDLPFPVEDAAETHAHDHAHDHDHHDHDRGHAEVTAHYVYRCAHPDRLDALEVRLFKTFPRLERLDVQSVGPRGQSAARLTPASPRLTW